MKKILLSFLMLCTALSAWSQTTYTTQTITLDYDDCDGNYKTTNAETGISVTAPKAENIACWQVGKYNPLQLVVPDGYIITAVKINYLNKNYLEALGISSSSINTCDNLVLNAESNIWEQKSGAFSRLTSIRFRSTTGEAYVTFVTITYHKHTFTHNETIAATCAATGKKESWTCSDCEHSYLDEKGANMVTKDEDLILPIDPTNHAVTLTKIDAVPATCVSEGTIEHWYCSACYHLFLDEAGTNMATKKQDLILPIDPTNHAADLKEVAGKNASVVEDGVYRHWHCDACNNDYADANGAENMTGKTVKARYDADALLIGNTTVDESYLFNGATATFDGNQVNLAIGSDNHQYELSKTERLLIDFAHTFTLKANQDPDSEGDYYATFYTSEGAYKVPSGAKAYTGNVEPTADPDVDALVMTDTEGLVHKSEPVILKASQSDITLMPSVNKETAAADNALTGTDDKMTLGANDFALTLGQNGVGFYLWEGKEIASNKAYLTLDPSSQVKALIFVFDDDPTADSINDIQRSDNSGNDVMYNLSGLRVDENYKGIVIKNGKKYLNK